MAAAPYGPWVRWAISIALAVWESHGGLQMFQRADEVNPIEGRLLLTKWSINGEIAYTTHRFINITADALDTSWEVADYAAVETAYDTMWTTLKPYYTGGVSLVEYRWYRFGPTLSPPHPVERIVPKAVVGTGGGTQVPKQVAMVIQQRTTVPRHWGRYYLPGPMTSHLTAEGAYTDACVDAFAGAAHTLYETCAAAELYPVVYSPTLSSVLGITRIAADNRPDIQRRRRPKGIPSKVKYYDLTH